MLTITWTWWINRGGVLYWDLEEGAEKRNRMVHILKNISIFGALNGFQSMAKHEESTKPCRPSWLQGFVTSLRPWSFSAVVTPLLVTLAILRVRLQQELPSYLHVFGLIVAMIAVQGFANLVNSYWDHRRGCDTDDMKGGDRTFVDSLISVELCLGTAGFLFAFWSAFFAWSIWEVGLNHELLACAIVGSSLAYLYTGGPFPLKYNSLGDVTILACFGPVLVSYASIFLVGQSYTEVVMFSLPVSIYVVAILQANNHRDARSDIKAGAHTLAANLGAIFSMYYYFALILLAHLIAVGLYHFYGCVGALATLTVLPRSLWLMWRLERGSRVDRTLLITQDEETAKTQLLFGLALAIGVTSMPGLEASPFGFGAVTFVVTVLQLLG